MATMFPTVLLVSLKIIKKTKMETRLRGNWQKISFHSFSILLFESSFLFWLHSSSLCTAKPFSMLSFMPSSLLSPFFLSLLLAWSSLTFKDDSSFVIFSVSLFFASFTVLCFAIWTHSSNFCLNSLAPEKKLF